MSEPLPKTEREAVACSELLGRIAWEDYGNGDYTPGWSGYTCAPAMTGRPDLGWCLYSRGAGGCWNQRTKAVIPPESDAAAKRIDGEWWWVRSNDQSQRPA